MRRGPLPWRGTRVSSITSFMLIIVAPPALLVHSPGEGFLPFREPPVKGPVQNRLGSVTSRSGGPSSPARLAQAAGDPPPLLPCLGACPAVLLQLEVLELAGELPPALEPLRVDRLAHG